MNSRPAAVAFLAGTLLLALGAAVGLYWLARQHQPLPDPDDPAEARREVIEAFQAGPVVPAPDGVQQFFDDFGACLRNGGADGERFWNAHRLAREADRDGVLTRAGVSPNHPDVRRGIQRGAANMTANMAVSFRYDTTEVRAVRWVVPDREVVVIARHTETADGEAVRFKMRWWLTNDGGWRAYDYEEVEVGGRASTVMGAAVAELAGGRPHEVALAKVRLERFHQARAALAGGEYETAGRLFADRELDRLPQSLRPIVTLWRAVAAVHLGRHPEALKLLAGAERELPDAAGIYLLRATCHAAAGDWEAVVAAGNKYVGLIGPDETVCLHLGNALHRLGRPGEAAAEYRRALDDVPDSIDALVGLARSLGAGGRAEVAERFARFPEPARHLTAVLAELSDEPEVAAAVVTGVRKKAPDDLEVLFQDARLRLAKGDVKGAVPLFLRVLERAGKRRGDFLARFADAAAEHGRAVEVYAAVPPADRPAAFKALAEAVQVERELTEAGKDDPLEALMAAHRARHPDDVLLSYYDGLLRHERGDHDRAEEFLAAGMARTLSAEDRERFRVLRVENLAAAGRPLDAYRRVGPPRATFGQLAYRLPDDEKGHRLLADLRALHERADPADPALKFWAAEAHYRRGEYAAAAAAFRAYRAAVRNQKDGADDLRAGEHLVRSLLRQNDLVAARLEMRPDDPKAPYNRVLDAAITAASGDVAATELALDELVTKWHYDPSAFHSDPDLGRLLKTPPFKKLLDKYPPPAAPGLRKA